MSETSIRVAASSLVGFIESTLVAAGARAEDATSVARALVDADLRGVDTHGAARLPAYVRLIDLGFIDLAARPGVQSRSGAVAVVDAGNGLGQPASEFSVDLACELAEEHGIGWVSTRRSNHFGCVGYYTGRAAARGFLALAGTNSAALVAPTRSTQRFLGTNPLAFGAPGSSGPGVQLDMSTSAVSAGKLERALREGRSVPLGWVLTTDGEDTTDPSLGIPEGGALLPLGGSEDHSSYKGFGLGLMVEILSSGLVRGAAGPDVGPLTSSTPRGPADVSHFFMVLDPARFGMEPSVGEAVDTLVERLRALPSSDPERPVLVPGDPESRQADERQRTGIPIHASVVATLDALAERLGVPTLSSSSS